MNRARIPLIASEVRQGWLHWIDHYPSRIPFLDHIILPLILLPAVALSTNSLVQAAQALLLVILPFGGYSLVVFAFWRARRKSRGEHREKVQARLISMAVIHRALTFLCIAVFFKLMARGTAGLGLPEFQELELGISIVVYLIISMIVLVRGADLNRLIFPTLVTDSTDHLITGQRQNYRRAVQLVLTVAVWVLIPLVIVLRATKNVPGQALLIVVMCNIIAGTLLFFAVLYLYQFVVLITD